MGFCISFAFCVCFVSCSITASGFAVGFVDSCCFRFFAVCCFKLMYVYTFVIVSDGLYLRFLYYYLLVWWGLDVKVLCVTEV